MKRIRQYKNTLIKKRLLGGAAVVMAIVVGLSNAAYALPQGGGGFASQHVAGYSPSPERPTPKPAGEGAARQSFPSSYSLIEQGEMTDRVSNQGTYGLCWTFASIGMIESSLFPAQDDDFSERALGYAAFHGMNNPNDYADGTEGDTYLTEEGKTWMNNGGDFLRASSTMMRGLGPVDEAVAPYDVSPAEFANVDLTSVFGRQKATLLNTKVLSNKDEHGLLQNSDIKRELMSGASVSISFQLGEDFYPQQYQGKTITTFYQKDYPLWEAEHHLVQIVGWDDDIPAELFSDYASGLPGQPEHPSGDGGWLCKNSWGESWGDGGYFWMSYEEVSLTDINSAEANLDTFDHHFQYAGLAGSTVSDSSQSVKGANVFCVQNAQWLKQVAYFSWYENITGTIRVYTDLTDASDPESGTLAAELSIDQPYAGWNRLALASSVRLSEGSRFSVVTDFQAYVTEYGRSADLADKSLLHYSVVEKSSEQYAQAHADPGESFLKYGSQDWRDVTEQADYGNVNISAYTDDALSGATLSAYDAAGTLLESDEFSLSGGKLFAPTSAQTITVSPIGRSAEVGGQRVEPGQTVEFTKQQLEQQGFAIKLKSTDPDDTSTIVLEVAISPEQITDPATGVTVSGNLPGFDSFSVTPVEVSKELLPFKADRWQGYQIQFFKQGQRVLPAQPVDVILPIPDDSGFSAASVYAVLANKALLVESTVSGSRLEFASRLDDDYYVAVQSKLPDPPSDTPSDNEVSPGNEAIPHSPSTGDPFGWMERLLAAIGL